MNQEILISQLVFEINFQQLILYNVEYKYKIRE